MSHIHIGLTSLVVCDSTSPTIIPKWSLEITNKATWIVAGNSVLLNAKKIKDNYMPTLERLVVNIYEAKSIQVSDLASIPG